LFQIKFNFEYVLVWDIYRILQQLNFWENLIFGVVQPDKEPNFKKTPFFCSQSWYIFWKGARFGKASLFFVTVLCIYFRVPVRIFMEVAK